MDMSNSLCVVTGADTGIEKKLFALFFYPEACRSCTPVYDLKCISV